MPKMRLYAVHPSEVLANGSAIDMTEHEFNESSIDWREEITQSEAKQILERTLYPFKKVRIIVIPLKHKNTNFRPHN